MNSRNNSYRGFGFYLVLILIVVGVWYFLDGNTTTNSYTRAAFEKDIQSGDVTAIDIVQNREIPTGSVNLTFSDSTQKVLIVSDVNEIVSYLQDQDITYYTMENVPAESWIMTLLPYLIIFGAMFIFFMIMTNQAAANAGGGSSKMMNFGKSRAKLMQPDAKKVTFANVAGLKEEKEELEEIVDFLRAPQKYTALGARIPKGVLLVGPPGTGKTLLAKAIAGEAGVPFFSISGSDFVEMFVGVGASRVRDLFEEAKKNAPCIVFIDEIDAVARRRGTGMGGGHDEREQTLNQMLVEMDGFGVNEGIIVMAATNRVDILDPAIMRPGRFDRKVYVGRPDIGGREEILAVHAKNKPLGDDVDLKQIAQTTAGFTGADLENLLNEAAIIAAKENRAYITQNDIKKSFVKVGIGAEKKSRIISDKEKRITAFHEAGHAILFHVLPDVGPVYSVYIIGYTFQTAVVKSGQSVITNDVKQRPMITFFDSTFIMLAHGLTAFYVSVYLIRKYGNFNSYALFEEFVITVVVLSGICTALAVIGIWGKDNSRYFQLDKEKKNNIHFRDYWQIMKHNKPIRMLVIAAASNKFASMVYSNSTVLVMLFGILMNNYPLAGIIGVIVGIPNLGIIYLGICYAKKVGQKKAMVVSTWFAIAFQAVMMYMMLFTDLTKVSLAEINGITIAFLLVFALLNGVKSITNNIVVPMIADCTDYEYTLSGHFVPGIMGALFSFIDKSFSALGTGFVGIALSMAGYAKVFPQVGDALTPQLKYMTVFFYCVIPILGWFVTIFIMRFYRLDKKAMSILYTKKGQKE